MQGSFYGYPLRNLLYHLSLRKKLSLLLEFFYHCPLSAKFANVDPILISPVAGLGELPCLHHMVLAVRADGRTRRRQLCAH
jgi:hypothetical protein